MSFKGVQIIKGAGGLGRKALSADAIFGIIATAPKPTGFEAFADVKKLIQLKDAEMLGIDAAFDANNDVLVYYHISEFFRLNPNGTLYLTILAQSETAESITTGNVSKLEAFIKSPIAKREIKYVGIVLNRATGYTYAYTDGVETDVQIAVPKAQATVDKLFTENIFIDGVLFGAKIDDTAIASLLDLRALEAQNVSITIARDKAIADVFNGDSSAVGTALGALSVRKVHENLGSVDIIEKPDIYLSNPNYSLTDNARSLWLAAHLTNNKDVNDLSPVEKKALTDKGYIYAGSYEGYSGIYFNDAPTCTAITDDYAYIESNRTFNKAARITVKTLTPKINSTIDIDPQSGFIAFTTISSWEETVKNAVGQMLKDGEVSSLDFFIDPKQNVLSGDPVETELAIVPKGIAREIKSTIGFKNPLI